MPILRPHIAVAATVICASLLLTESAAHAQRIRRVRVRTRPAVNALNTATAAYPPFVNQVMANFDRWDTDRDGVLSEKEVDAQVGSLETSGEPAAALAAIKLTLRGDKYDLPPLTRNYFLGYAQYASSSRREKRAAARRSPANGEVDSDALTVAGSEIADTDKTEKLQGYPGYERVFTSAVKRIQKAPPVLYTAAGPQLVNMHQGGIGDCYLLSVLGGLISRDQSAFVHMITQQADGSCKVVFPSGRSTVVQNLTDSEVAITSSTNRTGRWLSVLEEAYGNIKNTTLPEDKQDDVSTDLIAHGGSIRKCLRYLTGHEVTSMALRRKKAHGEWLTPTPEQVAEKLPGLRERLTKALGAGLLVGGGVEKYSRPPGIAGNHAYSIIAYMPGSDRVRIWNPHGNTFTPKGVPGLANGYPTRSGVFEMPLSEFAQVFGHVDFETAKPLKETK